MTSSTFYPKLIFTFLLTIGIGAQSLAQFRQPILSLKQTENNFGLIYEKDGPVTFDFVFANTGQAPLVIKDVLVTCGCTEPAWTREPVLPGAEGTISVTYDPKGRPGEFEKQVVIVSNASEPSTEIYIKGSVVLAAMPGLDPKYKYTNGNLRLDKVSLYYEKVFSNEVRVDTVQIYNTGDQPISFDFKELPAHFRMKAVPNILPPKSDGLFITSFDAKASGEYGFTQDIIEYETNDPIQLIKVLSVGVMIEEYFPPMSKKELEKAAHISFDRTEHSFGKVKSGAKVMTAFKVTNTGKENLYIRKISADCGCTVPSVPKKMLKPGESMYLDVEFDSEGKHGLDTKRVTVIASDPDKPSTQLIINADVQ